MRSQHRGRLGVAHDVGDRLGDDAVDARPRRPPAARGRAGGARGGARASSSNPRANSATAPTRPSWSSAVGRRSRTIRLTSTTIVSTSSARRPSSRERACRPRRRRSSWRTAVRRPSETPVSAGPSPSCRSRRSRRRSSSRADRTATLERRRSAARRTQLTASASGRGQLLEDGLVARSQRGRVGPADDQPADDLVVVAQQELPSVPALARVVGGSEVAARSHPSGPATSMATASSRISRPRLAARAGSRSSSSSTVLTWPMTWRTRARVSSREP